MRSGVICIRVKREEMKEVFHINRPSLTVRAFFSFSVGWKYSELQTTWRCFKHTLIKTKNLFGEIHSHSPWLYSNEKLSEGSVAFSLTSNDARMENGSGDSVSTVTKASYTSSWIVHYESKSSIKPFLPQGPRSYYTRLTPKSEKKEVSFPKPVVIIVRTILPYFVSDSLI